MLHRWCSCASSARWVIATVGVIIAVRDASNGAGSAASRVKRSTAPQVEILPRPRGLPGVLCTRCTFRSAQTCAMRALVKSAP